MRRQSPARKAPFFLTAACAFVVCTTASLAAHADDCENVDGFSPCIDVDGLWARPGNTRFFGTGPSQTTAAGELSFGAAVSYLRRPYRLNLPGPSTEPREVFVVDNALDATFLFALGITDRVEMTLAAPVTFYQDGAGYSATAGSDETLSRSAIRDPRLGVAVSIVERERTESANGFALLGRFEIAAPLGDGEAFAGSRGGTYVPAVTASYRFDRFEAAAEVGARIRGEEDLGEDTWGTQITTSLGLNVRIYEPIGLSASAEAWALPVVAEQSEASGPLVPAEWSASVRAAPFFAGDVFVQAGAGTAIPLTSFAATSPQARVLFTIGYAPLGLDSDGDGVLDRNDQCPGAREDRDGFKDDDGCLDPDNDGDRILDAQDRCRDEAETVDGFKDDDGCPDLDDDRDGIPDEEDQCRNLPEDKDRVDDSDGCPDTDDDHDGIPDVSDTCPTGAEDKDGYNDTDGCPDPDNDGDGTPDEKDKCQGQIEDKDGFADDDGCPDPDNDLDGVLDGSDKCPTEAETLDGVTDDDGCPEPNSKSLVRIGPDLRVGIDAPLKFKAKSADLSPDLEKRIALVARLAKGRGEDIVIIVEGYPDKPTDPGGEALGLRRAAAVKKALANAGFPERRITAASGDLTAKRAADAPQIELSLIRSNDHSE
ncbi:MAG: OmpA family protein [Polyangiaceae bacterium]|nr:OmpA family protein [Polyangiaceae bacterium]